MASIKVEKENFFSFDVRLPTSKSYANRFLILAALNPLPVTVHDLPQSSDVQTMIDLLRKIGLKIEVIDRGVRVLNCFPACEPKQNEPIVLETGDGGTTNRFISALLCLGSNRYILRPSQRMSERPMEEFIKIARTLGVQIRCDEKTWLGIQGPINQQVKSISVDAEKTTQILSAFAMVLDNSGIKIQIDNLYNSEKYWNLTQSLLIRKNDQEFTVPVDFSSASYPMALAAVCGEARFPQIFEADPYQADSALIEILRMMGAIVVLDQSGLLIKQSKLQAQSFNCALYPDLSPTLAFLAASSTGRSEFINTEILTYKETNRLDEIRGLLTLFEVPHETDPSHKLLVSPRTGTMRKSLTYNAPPDHRMVMAAYLFMRYFGTGTIYNIEHVNKSFPEFFEVMQNK